MMKTCTQCREAKALTAFSPNKTGKDGLHTWCKACKAASARLWQSRHAEHKQQYDRAYYLAHADNAKAQAKQWHRDNHARSLDNKRRWKLALHGLTDAQKDAMFKAQNCQCGSCGKRVEAASDLRVDHCHVTQQIRGLLCHHCNVGLGHFFDSPDLLRAAAAYLERTPHRKSA